VLELLERCGRAPAISVKLIGMRLCAIALIVAASGCLPLDYYDNVRECRGQEISAGLFDAEHCGTGDHCLECTSAPANAVPACINESKCGYSCVAGFADCNGDPADGCEQNIASDVANCGGCFSICHGECVSGGCHAHWDNEGSVVAISDLAPPFSAEPWRVYWLRTDGGTLDLRTIVDEGDVATLQSVPVSTGATPLLAQDGSFVYFSNGGTGDAGVIYSATGSSGLEIIASGIGAPGALVARDGTIYWTSRDTGEVLVGRPGGGVPQAVATGQGRPGAMVTDLGNLYWIDEDQGAVMALALDGGTPHKLSTRPFAPGPFALFVDFLEVVTLNSRTFADRSFPVWFDSDAGVIWGAPGGVAQPLTAPDAGVEPTQLFTGGKAVIAFDAAREEQVRSCNFDWPDSDGGLPLQLCDTASYPTDTIFLSPGTLFFTDGGSISSLPH
jgi:hypothetical protein